MTKTNCWIAAALLASLCFPGAEALAQPPSVQVGFYDVLTPHGDWVSISGVGTVWRPSVRIVGDDFYPYSSGGHWQYTQYGWSWESNWAWGWVPFHHGRWIYTDAYSWVWVPDDVWGPAWVEWRVGGGYVGWVPMGPSGIEVVITGYHPRWSWVHAGRLSDRDFHRSRLNDLRAEEAAFRAASPVLHRDRAAPRGPDPKMVFAPGVPVPRVTISAPRTLIAGSVTSERRLVRAPSAMVPAPPGAARVEREAPPHQQRPLVAPAPSPFVAPPPGTNRSPDRDSPREQPGVLRREQPEPGRPSPRQPDVQPQQRQPPGQLVPRPPPQQQPQQEGVAPGAPGETTDPRKKDKRRPGVLVPAPGGAPQGKPRGRPVR